MIVLAFVTLGTVPAAAADPIEDKRAEAAAIATRLEEQARRIVELDIQHRQAQKEVDDAQAAIAHAEAEIAATTRRQVQLKELLVTQAQDAYVVGGSVSLLKYLMRTDEVDAVARRAYLRIVTGQDRKVLGQLRAVREDLEYLRARLNAARQRARSRAGDLAEDRAALDRAVRAQRANLTAVNGEVAGLVAAEQARRDAEAAAARRAAQEAAAREAAAREATARAPAANAAPSSTAPVAATPGADPFACVRQLESGNNYASEGGGAYQFLDSTWQSLGYSGSAEDAPPAVQDEAAQKLLARDGWSQWTTAPLCGRA